MLRTILNDGVKYMQVFCPQCEELGYLQRVNPEFFRVRHYTGKHLSKNGKEVSTFSMAHMARVYTTNENRQKLTDNLFKKYGKYSGIVWGNSPK
jgi:hypothetical protein